MSLSENLKDQFAKIVNTNADSSKENTDNTVYGTVKVYSDGTKAVVLDGSNIATPFETVTDAEDGDRVTVTIKNHKAIVTGNLSSPAARTDAVKSNSEKIGEFNTVLSNKVDTDELNAVKATIEIVEADNATIKQKLSASEGEFNEIKTKQLEVEEKVTAAEAEIKTIKSDKIDATVVESEYTKTKEFEALAGTVGTLSGDFSNFKNTATEKLDAQKADIDDLNTKKLNAEDADLKYANIDFTNIGTAAMQYFYAQSGLIKNAIVGDQTITGELVGVTIKGDLIEGNTIVADKLVIKGEDGLYYKLNTDGITTEAEQTDYNSINGQVIRAKSVTASKIDVKDLVAFDATIAGFKIDDNAIYSIGKESATSGVRGIYLSKDGQMAVGDSNHYIKYYKDTDGSFKLAISAESMTLSSGKTVEDVVNDIQTKVDGFKSIINSLIEYQAGDSGTDMPTGAWSANIPEMESGQYMWTRTTIMYSDGSQNTAYSVGGKGTDGIPGTDGSKIVVAPISYGNNDYWDQYSEASFQATIDNGYIDGYQVTSSDGISIGDIALCKNILSDTKRLTYAMLKVTEITPNTIHGKVIGQTTGPKGTDGVGISFTDVTYQAGSSGIVPPTGTWSNSVPNTTAQMPYMWTRTVIKYTDNTTSTSYSVGATPEGVLDKVYTKTESDSEISKTKTAIEQSVSTTYQRKDAMGNYYTAAQTDAAIKTRGDAIELKVNGIQSTVDKKFESYATTASLSVYLTKTDTGQLKSMIEAIADTINITAKGGLNLSGNRFSVSSTNLTIKNDGSMTCKNLSVTGGIIDLPTNGRTDAKVKVHSTDNTYYSVMYDKGFETVYSSLGMGYRYDGIHMVQPGALDIITINTNGGVKAFFSEASITARLKVPCNTLALKGYYTTTVNSVEGMVGKWTVKGPGLLIVNASCTTEGSADTGTTNCCIYLDNDWVGGNRSRLSQNYGEVIRAGANFIWYISDDSAHTLEIDAGSTQNGTKKLLYSIQGLFGLKVT